MEFTFLGRLVNLRPVEPFKALGFRHVEIGMPICCLVTIYLCAVLYQSMVESSKQLGV
jgi:hypothetical protein